jgi:hypothetical protein
MCKTLGPTPAPQKKKKKNIKVDMGLKFNVGNLVEITPNFPTFLSFFFCSIGA